jgi:tetraacyldisaccharide 4'-kinase
MPIDPQGFHALIRGERGGCTATSARAALAVASGLFGAVAGLRRKAYDVGALKAHRAGVPVISVGNLTVGGTGKTPLVIHLARELIDRGERVAVLARGYGAPRDGDLNDELRQVQEEVPEAILFPGKDRVARSRDATDAGATVLLLDDGFQHRRLARDVDIVILDATEPWGAPPRRLLPRGLLREPPSALQRADVVVFSRVELVGRAELGQLEAEVSRLGFYGSIARMPLHPTQVVHLATPSAKGFRGTAPISLRGVPVLAACGIGNPNAFGATLASLGAQTSQLVALPDHHAYTDHDVKALEDLAERRALKTVVVTFKDAVKLRDLLAGPRRVTWVALGIEARLEPATAVDDMLERARFRAAEAKRTKENGGNTF